MGNRDEFLFLVLQPLLKKHLILILFRTIEIIQTSLRMISNILAQYLNTIHPIYNTLNSGHSNFPSFSLGMFRCRHHRTYTFVKRIVNVIKGHGTNEIQSKFLIIANPISSTSLFRVEGKFSSVAPLEKHLNAN